MTDALTSDTHETLWITDAELIRRMGVPEKIARRNLRLLTDKPSGFPKPNPLVNGCRYWPDVRAWFDKIHGLDDPHHQPKPTPPTSFTVYFIGSGDHIKIGVTTRPVEYRLSALATAHFQPMTLLATIENAPETLERELHKRFASCRARREWFKATPELLAFIETLKAKP